MVAPPAAALLILAMSMPAGSQQQAFTLRSDRIEIDEEQQWKAWQIPFGTVTVDERGVTANRVAGVHNASRDAFQFPIEADDKLGGAFAGSNSKEAQSVMDGRADTYWSPNLDQAPETWWLQMDLGRAVSVERITLRFAEEGEGDPFYQFRLLVTNGETLTLSDKLRFHEVGRTESPNRNQREFTFELSPTKPIDGVFEGDVIQYIQMSVTDSRRGRAEVIPKADWDGLPAAQKGDIQYFGRSQSGREWEVSEEIFNVLPVGEQGEPKYYRKERPRLAEIEVWTYGQNVIHGTYKRGGIITGERSGQFLSVDGDFYTGYEVQDKHTKALADPENRIVLDLGSSYWLDRVRSLFGSEFRTRTFVNYRLLISDGTLAPDGTLLWMQVDAREGDGDGIFHEARFPLTVVRYIGYSYEIITVPWTGHGGQVPIREFQGFGRGYQPVVELESPLIDLGSLLNLTTIHWQAQTPPGTQIEISTRTGNETDIIRTYYRKGTSDPITETVYNGLPSSFKGPIDSTIVEGSDWSEWSRPVEASGDQVVSPSPRRLMKVRARLTSDDPEQTAVLKQLEVRYSRAWVTQALGEVYPTQLAALGAESPLTLYLFPRRGATSRGVDEILVTTTGQVPLRLRQLRLGTSAQLAEEGGGTVEAEVEVMATGADSLWLRLPSVVRRNQLVAVDMNAVIFGQGMALSVQVGNTSSSGAWQRVDADQGAVASIQSGVLRVLAPPGGPRIEGLVLSTPVVTPNGDDVNDALELTFDVVRVDGERAVTAQMYDLSGRLLWEEEQMRARASGSYAVRWSGVDAFGTNVAPGVYLLRLSVDAQRDAGSDTDLLRPIHVVY